MASQMPSKIHKKTVEVMNAKGLEEKIQMWWPQRGSLSLHIGGVVLLSSVAGLEDFVQTIAVNQEGYKNMKAEEIVEIIQGGLANCDSLWPIELQMAKDPRPYGKKPKGQ